MNKIKVLIVDDSAFIRQMLHEILAGDSGIEVVGTACDPLDAREKIKLLTPDVITLDIEMPKMDGLSFLEKIMALRPMPVVMVSSLTQKGAEATLRALELGAFDYVGKPATNQTSETITALGNEIIAKIKAAGRANIINRKNSIDSNIVRFNPPAKSRKIIAIGASTGGVEALRDIFVRLPANSPPIVITQHMPEHFTKSFAARLDSISNLKVGEAANHARLQNGHAYLAPGNIHLKIVRIGNEFVCKLQDGDRVSGHKPSVDVLFDSVAESVGENAVGVILTGMGKDGAEGMLNMRNKGAYNIGQSEQSCVVYGMPKVAMQTGGVHIEAPIEKIAELMLKECEKIGS